MKFFIEGSVFFRTLNYLRVKHPYAVRYNLVYPLLGALVHGLPAIIWGDVTSYYESEGVLASFVPVLSILAPFFIASLAAVSTFQGPRMFDETFKMNGEVTLLVTGEGGDWKSMGITPRHFLSLLFGYCSVASIALLAFVIFAPVLGVVICSAWPSGSVMVLSGFFLIFAFCLCQLVLGTLLGIYYLADRIHRD